MFAKCLAYSRMIRVNSEFLYERPSCPPLAPLSQASWKRTACMSEFQFPHKNNRRTNFIGLFTLKHYTVSNTIINFAWLRSAISKLGFISSSVCIFLPLILFILCHRPFSLSLLSSATPTLPTSPSSFFFPLHFLLQFHWAGEETRIWRQVQELFYQPPNK